MAINHSEKNGKYVLLVDTFDRQEFDKNDVFKRYTRFVKGDLLNLSDEDADRLLGANAVALASDKAAVEAAQAEPPAPTPTPEEGGPAAPPEVPKTPAPATV